MSPEPFVVIVVLSWNGREDTRACLCSLETLVYARRIVLVIDNGSDDGSPAMVRAEFPHVHLIANPANRGYAAGNNQGLRWALDHGADLVWLLNNDVLVEPDSLTELVRALQTDPTVGIVGPVIHRIHQPGWADVGGRFDFWTGYARVLLWEPAYEGLETLEVDYVWGCSLLVRAEVLHAVGLLDPRWVAYFEDADLSQRARARGWRTVTALRAHVQHHIARSGNKVYLWQTWMRLRNYVLFYAQYARPIQWPGLFLAFALVHIPLYLYRSAGKYVAYKLLSKYKGREMSLWYRGQ
ncbi:MAG: glycosyltransferase family 2 protein [Chloroflexi bacterium]|nr:glycosyltransferase family 2 protein [Chloroflexota bacterium]MBU1747039.1 glycosyltransferase family 2 protein [Chloroflexota bacterium]